jgi:hypothetical protein
VGHADVGQAAICARSDIALNLLDMHLIGVMGRRKVLRLPDGRRTDELGDRVLADRSAHPFAPGVDLQDIEARVDAGATVEVLDGPPAEDDLLLAAVSPDGAVNLQPGVHTPGPEDAVIALVGSKDA